MKWIRLLLWMSCVLLSSPAWAATYHVNKAGNNTPNNCTTAQSATPSQGLVTITAGMACLSAGDTLVIHVGTYTEQLLNPPSGISSVSRTTVRSAGDGAVIINGTGTGNHLYVLDIENKQFITIDGFVFRGTNTGGLAVVSIGDDVNDAGGPGSSYITLQNSEVDGVGIAEYCVRGHNSGSAPKSHHISILNNLIHDCGHYNSNFPPNGTRDSYDGHAIYPVWSDSLHEGNTIYGTGNSTVGGAAIHQYNGGAGGLDRNIYRNNTVYDNYGPAILIRDGVDDLVYNNIVYGNNILVESGGAITVGNQSARALIANNTVVSNHDWGIQVGGDSADAIIRNNIVYQNSVGNYGLNVNPQFGDNATGTLHDHNLEGANPFFTNAGAFDFTLTASSTGAINQGVAIAAVTDDFDGHARPIGAGYDIGAYEYGAVVPPPTSLITRDFVQGKITSSENVMSHTYTGALVSGSANRLLLAFTTFNSDSEATTSVVFNTSEAMTRQDGASIVSAGFTEVQTWALTNPTPTTANIVATTSFNNSSSIYAVSLSGVNTAAPVRSVGEQQNGAGSAMATTNITLTTVAGDLVVFGVFARTPNVTDPGNMVASVGTELEDLFVNGANTRSSFAYVVASGTSTTVSYSWTNPAYYVFAAVAVAPADATPPGSPTSVLLRNLFTRRR